MEDKLNSDAMSDRIKNMMLAGDAEDEFFFPPLPDYSNSSTSSRSINPKNYRRSTINDTYHRKPLVNKNLDRIKHSFSVDAPSKPVFGSLPEPSLSTIMPDLELPPTPLEDSYLNSIAEDRILKPSREEDDDVFYGSPSEPRSLIREIEGFHHSIPKTFDYAASCPASMAVFPSHHDMFADSPAAETVLGSSVTAFSLVNHMEEQFGRMDINDDGHTNRSRPRSFGGSFDANSFDGEIGRNRNSSFDRRVDEDMPFDFDC
jgi:hypothetical protein